jgi:hypothetical protein
VNKRRLVAHFLVAVALIVPWVVSGAYAAPPVWVPGAPPDWVLGPPPTTPPPITAPELDASAGALAIAALSGILLLRHERSRRRKR